MKRWIPLYAALLATPGMGQVIVDDSWTDGGRDNGADALDTDWWTSTASTAIEVGPGFLGLVTGTSGRGIHGTFPSQTLAIGETLVATFTFTTPATVSAGSSTAFRVGLFDTTGKPGLSADLSASSGSPNPIYNNLLGYMIDYDVNTATADIAVRERTNAASGQLLAATGDYTSLGTGGDLYAIAPNTSYTGVLSLALSASGLEITGSISQGANLLSTFSVEDATVSTATFGMLAFHANSNTFGTSNTPNTDDNGIDFTNVRVELIPIPEPAMLGALSVGLLALRRHRRHAVERRSA